MFVDGGTTTPASSPTINAQCDGCGALLFLGSDAWIAALTDGIAATLRHPTGLPVDIDGVDVANALARAQRWRVTGNNVHHCTRCVEATHVDAGG